MQMAPSTVCVSISGRRHSALAMAIGATPTMSTATRSNAPLTSVDVEIASDPSDDRKATATTSAARRNNRRLTCDALSAASSVSPWSVTLTTRTYAPDGSLAMNTNVTSSNASTSPKRYPGRFPSSQSSMARGCVVSSFSYPCSLRVA